MNIREIFKIEAIFINPEAVSDIMDEIGGSGEKASSAVYCDSAFSSFLAHEVAEVSRIISDYNILDVNFPVGGGNHIHECEIRQHVRAISHAEENVGIIFMIRKKHGESVMFKKFVFNHRVKKRLRDV